MNCGVGHRRGSDWALLGLWGWPAAVAPIPPLAWEPPYVAGVAPPQKKLFFFGFILNNHRNPCMKKGEKIKIHTQRDFEDNRSNPDLNMNWIVCNMKELLFLFLFCLLSFVF